MDQQLQLLRNYVLWIEAMNILNKQSRTSDKGCSSSLWVGRLLAVKTYHITNYSQRPRTWNDPLVGRKQWKETWVNEICTPSVLIWLYWHYITSGAILLYWRHIPRHGCMSVVRVVCCHVKVSATGWSLTRRSPTECGVSECDREASTMRGRWPTRGCHATVKI